MRDVSVVARHQPMSTMHELVLSFHGIVAILGWLVFTLQWLLPTTTKSHIRRGYFIFWAFFFPMGISGLFLIPYLMSNVQRSNLTMSSGPLIVPTQNFHLLISIIRAFPFLRNRYSSTFLKIAAPLNFILQVLGSFALAYKISSHSEQGMRHENNIELLVTTLPFTILQGIVVFRPHLRFLGHTFFIKYLTLHMFPGTTIVIARDKYWLWGQQGLSLYPRLFLQFIPTIPFFYMVLPVLLARKKAKAAK
ncbi:hypothetical protein BKA57DRAFT_422946 [Linnemannia elongata]|nr:hypothetical protein BKA57DRAFT_422946 [Linnemannia elongata]